MSHQLTEIKQAIDSFDLDKARSLLRQAIRNNPSADVYLLAAQAAITEEQRIDFLEKATQFDPFHTVAIRELQRIRKQQVAKGPPIAGNEQDQEQGAKGVGQFNAGLRGQTRTQSPVTPLTTQGRKPMDWYLGVFQKYADFSGRSRRTEYWMFALFNMIASVALIFIDAMLGTISREVGIGLLSGLYGLAALLPGIAVLVRRLHDIGKSGWWLLIVFVPLIGAIVLFVFVVMDSQPGENQYGSNPKTA